MFGVGEDTIPSTTSSTCSGSAAPGRSRTGRRRRRKAFAELLHRGRRVRGARRRRDLHRRPGPPDRQRVPLPDARPAERRGAERGSGRRSTIVATCPHCFNTLSNEYPQLGGSYEVVHHTQLLDRLVREGRLTPVRRRCRGPSPTTTRATWAGTTRSSTPPREVLGRLPGSSYARCRAAASAPSAAAPAARGCGWRSGSASGSTTAPRRQLLAHGAEAIAVGLPVLPPCSLTA